MVVKETAWKQQNKQIVPPLPVDQVSDNNWEKQVIPFFTLKANNQLRSEAIIDRETIIQRLEDLEGNPRKLSV